MYKGSLMRLFQLTIGLTLGLGTVGCDDDDTLDTYAYGDGDTDGDADGNADADGDTDGDDDSDVDLFADYDCESIDLSDICGSGLCAHKAGLDTINEQCTTLVMAFTDCDRARNCYEDYIGCFIRSCAPGTAFTDLKPLALILGAACASELISCLSN
jgi:hypothetical protein